MESYEVIIMQYHYVTWTALNLSQKPEKQLLYHLCDCGKTQMNLNMAEIFLTDFLLKEL